tara:strand:- start:286 stop:957 length:672 start_codon:yes stop_codon:yes gene_type:complete
MASKSKFILGLDVSTKTIGVAVYEDKGVKGELKILTHVTPKIKPLPESSIEQLIKKGDIFESDFLNNYSDFGISRVIIEEPLLRSNNVNTVATLLRFNGMVCRSVYQKLGVIPEFISSFDARKYAFPELMAIRTHNKKGIKYPNKQIQKKIDNDEKTLFGAYPWDIDKKKLVWEKIADLEPQITWVYNRNNVLAKENFDMSDAAVAVLGFMNKIGEWDPSNRK